MISIIIPVYNAESDLGQCLDSILALEYKDWECLLIDDGSKDTSPLICDKYATKDSRFIVFHKTNEGVSSARNLGLDNAKGDWICFIDADDYISANYLNNIEKSSADIIFFTSKSFREGVLPCVKNDLGIILTYDRNSTKEKLRDILHLHLLRVPWGKIIKRRCIGNIRFFPCQNIGEDTVFIYSILNHVNSMMSYPDHFYFWRDYSCNETIKYRLNVHNATLFFENIFKAYLQLDVMSVRVEHFLLFYFWKLIDKNVCCSFSEWFNSKCVKECELGLRQKQVIFPRIYSIYKKSGCLGFIVNKLIMIYRSAKKDK